MKHLLLILMLSCATVMLWWNAAGAAQPEIDAVDWPAFLAEQDMCWKKLPSKWYEGPFLGNGEQGTLMYKLDDRTLRWDVGCSAAHDHRPIDEDDLAEKDVRCSTAGGTSSATCGWSCLRT